MTAPQRRAADDADPMAHRRSIERAVRAGEYRVDAMDVADALLRSWLMEDVVDRWRSAHSAAMGGASEDSSS